MEPLISSLNVKLLKVIRRLKKQKELVDEYRRTFANPMKAAELGYIDEVILPENLRSRLVQSFDLLKDKRQSNPPKKHGNIPL